MQKRVLITGASRGLGRALAIEAARRGYVTILVGRDASRLDELLDYLETISPSVHHRACVMDISTEHAVNDLTEFFELHGWPELIIHNAASTQFGPFATLSPEIIETVIRVIIRFPLLLTREVLPFWMEQKRGTLVFIGSTSGRKPVPFNAVYAASKGFIHQFAPALAEELKPHSIHVSLYIIGGMKTSFQKQAGFPDEYRAGNLEPESVAQRIWNDLAGERYGVFTIGSMKERLGGWLQRLLPPTWWAKKMAERYRPLVTARSSSEETTWNEED